MEGVWTLCDVFWDFDPMHTGHIVRSDYIRKLKEPPSVDRLRILRRTKLKQRFCDSAQPVALEELLEMMWPTATEEDRMVMHRWVQLREARSVLTFENFCGTKAEMKRTFELLDGKGERLISASEVSRADILNKDDVARLARSKDPRRCKLDLDEFRSQFWPALKAAYVTRDTIFRMKKEEEAQAATSFEVGLRAGFGTSGTIVF